MELEHKFTIPVSVDKAWPALLDIRRVAECMPGAAVDTVDGDDFTGSVKVKLGPINLTYKGQAKFLERDEQKHRAVIDARGRDSRGNGTASAKITATLTDVADGSECTVITDLNITGKPAQFGRGVMVDVGNKLIGQFADCLAGKLAADDSGAADSGADESGAKSADSTPTSTMPAVSASQAAADKAASDSAKTAAGSAPRESAQVDADQEAAKSASSPAQSTPAAGSAPAATPAARPAAPVATSTPRSADPEPIDLLELAGGSVAKRAVPAILGLALLGGLIAWLLRRNK